LTRFRPHIAALLAGSAVLAAACTQPPVNTDPLVAGLTEGLGRAELGRSPERADILGVSTQVFGRDYHSELDDRSIAGVERARVSRVSTLGELEKADRSTLSPKAIRQLDAATYTLAAAVRMDAHGYGSVRLGQASPYLINPASGAYVDLVRFLSQGDPVRSRHEAEAWLARLRKMPEAMRDERWRFEIDMEAGATPPRLVLQHTLDKVRVLTPMNPREHPLTLFFIEALSQIPDLPEADMKKLVDEAAEIVGNNIAPEYKSLTVTLEKALKTASDDPGVWRLKGGDGYYRDALHLYTSTDLPPKEVHDLGVKLVDQISQQMDVLLVQIATPPAPPAAAPAPAATPPATPGQSTPAAPKPATPKPVAEKPTTPKPALPVGVRMQALAREPAFLYADTDEGRAAMAAAIQTQTTWAAGHLGRMVSVVPRRAVEIRQVPALDRDFAPPASYSPVAIDGTRPAIYALNLGPTADWPMWRLPTLSFSTTTPGHHLQQGLERERWNGAILSLMSSDAGFSDGWAVYGEDLADEIGAYAQDPRARLGYLQSLLFSAAMLVVDTGIHSDKWTRQQAVDYLVATTGLPRAEMESAVDRAMIWPGAACAGMVGRQTIRRLRDSADKELGPDFDLKAFHDVMLAGGARPLPGAEADVHDWIISRRQPPAPK
jgi:uncharacterized protein (DUF885 family)